MTIIDTHVHEWTPSRARPAVDRRAHPVLHAPHSLTDLTASIGPDVAGVVLVAAGQENDRENASLADLATIHSLVIATVGQLDLHADDFGEQLRQAGDGDSRFRGIRYTLRHGVDGPWTERATANARRLGSDGFLLEILAAWNQMGEVVGIAAAMPDVPIVVDHIATAPPDIRDVEDWLTTVDRLASSPNVTAKLSNFDIPVEADVGHQIRRIIDMFGPERLMFASNWPVSLRYGSYDDVLQATVSVLDRLSADARESIMYRTAARVFGVEPLAGNHKEMHAQPR